MLRRLHHLNGCIIAYLRRVIRRQGHLREAEAAVVLLVRRAEDLEDLLHGEGVVLWNGAFAQVDVEEGGGVAGEPAGLDADGAAGDGPQCSVC